MLFYPALIILLIVILGVLAGAVLLTLFVTAVTEKDTDEEIGR